MKKILILVLAAFCSTNALISYSNSAEALTTGWVKDGTHSQYFDKSGKAYKNTFLTIGEDTYYFNSYGNMVTNDLVKVGSNYYYLDNNGHRFSGWIDLKYKTNFSNMFLFDYGDNKDINGKHYFRNDGTMLRNSLLKSGDKTYGFNDFGVQLIDSYAKINGKEYYFDKTGVKSTIKLKTMEDVEAYMNGCYSTLDLPSGDIRLSWSLREGDHQDDPYDYSLCASIEPNYFSDSYKTKSALEQSIYELSDPEKYSDEDRNNANKKLQSYSIKAAKSMMKIDSKAKVETYFCEMWWDYSERWRVYSNNSHYYTWATCRNFETSDKNEGKYGYTKYKRTSVTKLHWYGSYAPFYKF